MVFTHNICVESQRATTCNNVKIIHHRMRLSRRNKQSKAKQSIKPKNNQNTDLFKLGQQWRKTWLQRWQYFWSSRWSTLFKWGYWSQQQKPEQSSFASTQIQSTIAACSWEEFRAPCKRACPWWIYRSTFSNSNLYWFVLLWHRSLAAEANNRQYWETWAHDTQFAEIAHS